MICNKVEFNRQSGIFVRGLKKGNIYRQDLFAAFCILRGLSV